MKYCFIANYYLTPLQSAVARRLTHRNIEICWIVVNSRLVENLVQDGWPREHILHLRLDMPNSINDEDFTDVPIKFHDLLYADRALRHEPETGLRYLNAAAFAIQDFIELQNPQFIFGEITWAHERIAAAICAASGSRWQYLMPHTVRFPSERWGFFAGEGQALLVGGEKCLNSFEQAPAMPVDLKPPAYVARNNELLASARTLRARLGRLRRFITREDIDPTDPTHIQRRIKSLWVVGREELNRTRYRFVKRIPADSDTLARPFVLYAMHKQPESSIDVLGNYYEDQARIINVIWRSLPPSWSLYVKEHTNAIGDRSPHFYKHVNALPNAYMIDETASARELIKAAKAVFTISGTIAYEAALMGRQSFTFVPMFFNRLECCTYVQLDDLRNCWHLGKLIQDAALYSEAKPFDIIAESFEGRFTDTRTDPTVMDDANLRAIELAFASLGSFRSSE
jgi:hypothetical protein